MPTLAERFEQHVDGDGPHHIWKGAGKASGAGVLKVEGKVVTATRVAWELAYGALPPGFKVGSCPHEAMCVGADHLSVPELGSRTRRSTKGGRSRRGNGSMREKRPGVWELGVTAGRYSDGTARRVYRTISGATRAQAARALAEFIAEIGVTSVPVEASTRQLSVDDAVETFLTEHLLREKGARSAPSRPTARCTSVGFSLTSGAAAWRRSTSPRWTVCSGRCTAPDSAARG